MLEQKPESFFLSHDPEGVDPLDLIEPFLKSRWAVGLIIIFSLTLAILFNLYATPIYQARSRVVLRQNVKDNVLREKETDLQKWAEPRTELKTKLQIISSQKILQKLAEQLIERGHFQKDLQAIQYDRMKPEDKTPVLQGLAASLQGNLKVENPKDTNIIDIIYASADPYLAKDVVNLLAELVVEDHRDEQLLVMKDSLSYLNQQLEDSRKRVEESESKLYEYRRKHNIFEADRDKELIAERRSRLVEKLTEVQENRRQLEAKIGQLEKLLSRQDYLKYTALLPDNSILIDLKQQLVTAEVNYKKLLIRYEDKHPDVEKSKQEIEILKQKFEQELRVALIQLQSQLNVVKAQDQFLQDTLAETEKSAVMSTEKDIDYVVLDRDANSARDNYRTLLAAVKEVTINTNSTANNVIYVQEKALTPRRTIKPRKSRNILLGLALGIMLGGAFAYGREYLDQTIRTPEDVQKTVKLPVLSTVPLDTRKKTQVSSEPERLLLVTRRPKSLFSESITALRSQLSIKLPSDSPQVILVTSCVPQEGKSLIAANLALSLAINGQKTLLIDADLHHPVVHEIFGREKGSTGLYDLVVDALNPPWSTLNLDTMSLGDVQHLIQLKQWSGTINIVWDSLASQLKMSYHDGRLAGSNFKAWQEQFSRPNGFPPPKNLSFSLNENEILNPDGQPNSGLLALDFLHQYPNLCRSAYFGDLVLQQYVQPTDHKNLFSITAGTNPKNPGEILGSEQMKILLKVLKERYDRIIIDSPPAWPLSDVSVLSPMIDCILWICRAGKIPRKIFTRIIQQVQRIQPNIIGVVINAVDLQRDRYYYYGYPYYYYNKRYYHHYYGSKDETPELEAMVEGPVVESDERAG